MAGCAVGRTVWRGRARGAARIAGRKNREKSAKNQL
jgi:hypothetical protein